MIFFNTWNFLDFDYEERNGSDAIRFRYFTSNSSSVEIAWGPSGDFNNQIAAVLYKFNYEKYDIQFLGGQYKKDIVLGAGFAGSIGSAGFSGEGTCFYPYSNQESSDFSVAMSLSIDKTYKGNWYLNGSLLYISEVANAVMDISGSFRNMVSARQLMPWHWSLYLQAMKQVSPPVTIGFAACVSPTDFNTIYLPSVSWMVKDDFELELVGQSFFNENERRYYVVSNSLFLRMRASF